MAKLFIDVNTPGNGKSYEFQLDSRMKVGEAKERIVAQIVEIENGNITLNEDKILLLSAKSCQPLDKPLSLGAAQVRSGQTLILI